jgi:hypothetical protein
MKEKKLRKHRHAAFSSSPPFKTKKQHFGEESLAKVFPDKKKETFFSTEF